MKQRHSVEHGFSIYAGLDWGTTRVFWIRGKILRECRIDHSGQAIMGFLREVNEMVSGKVDCVAVAIEVPRGPFRHMKRTGSVNHI